MIITRGKAHAAATLVAAAGILIAAVPAQAGIQGNFVATTPSGYTFTVPSGDTVVANAYGAKGGDYNDDPAHIQGGLGALATGVIAVTPGQRLSIVVGGQGTPGGSYLGDINGCQLVARQGGYPGGGPSGEASSTGADAECTIGGSGGGASRVLFYGGSTLLVAAGGGGGSFGGLGGDGGAPNGATGGTGESTDATGGTLTAGGQPASSTDCFCHLGATAGTQTNGGIGGEDHFILGIGGAGGGEGWWGGGGAIYSGAGGGSSYASDVVANARFAAAVQNGNGAVTLDYGVADVPQFTDHTPPDAAAGVAFSYQLSANGWPESAYRVVQGLLPTGFTLDADGLLHGTATQAGTYFVSVRADNGIHTTDQLVRIVVDPGGAASLTSPGSEQTTLAGTTFPNDISARVVDANGNGVPGVTVHFALPAGTTARFSSTGTATADATSDGGGWADAGTLAAGSKPGPLPVTVQAPGAADLTIDLAVTAGALSVAPAQVVEGNARTTAVKVLVTLQRAATGPVTVNWSTADGSATAGSDYRAASGTLTFKARKTQATITLKVLGDRLVEPDETFAVQLSSPTGATIAVPNATVTILNDD